VIEARLKKGPPLRTIEVVVYRDSPDTKTPPVAELLSWAKELKVEGKKSPRVDLLERDEKAPVE
jgi:hypothetical protein